MKNLCKKLTSTLLCLTLIQGIMAYIPVLAQHDPTSNNEPVPHPITGQMGDIHGGEAASHSWILRGDEEGEYELTVDYAATLLPFEEPVEATFATADPLVVHAAQGLAIYLHPQSTAMPGGPVLRAVRGQERIRSHVQPGVAGLQRNEKTAFTGKRVNVLATYFGTGAISLAILRDCAYIVSR